MKDPARMQPTILVVEDNDVFRSVLVNALEQRGYDAVGVPDGASALAAATADSPEMAVVDMRLPDMSGLDVVRELKAIDATTAVVVLTGYGSIATAIDAIRIGATYYLHKPADADEILAAFDRGGISHGSGAPAPEVPTPSLARAEWEHINRVLADCAGNISEAARRLGMHRRSLQRKLQKRPPTN